MDTVNTDFLPLTGGHETRHPTRVSASPAGILGSAHPGRKAPCPHLSPSR